jgi:hypothetical protein
MSVPAITSVDYSSLGLDLSHVLVGEGLDPAAAARSHPAVAGAARRALREAPTLVRAVTLTRRIPCAGVLAEAGMAEHLARRLSGAEHLLVCACTIGPAVEARAAAAHAGNLLEALAFDALGSAAVGRLAATVCAATGTEAASLGLAATPPISPGLDGWPLDAGQRFIFSRLDAAAIGIALTPAWAMVPQKSMSFVIGLGAGVAAGTACALCSMARRCRYRGDHA